MRRISEKERTFKLQQKENVRDHTKFAHLSYNNRPRSRCKISFARVLTSFRYFELLLIRKVFLRISKLLRVIERFFETLQKSIFVKQRSSFLAQAWLQFPFHMRSPSLKCGRYTFSFPISTKHPAFCFHLETKRAANVHILT